MERIFRNGGGDVGGVSANEKYLRVAKDVSLSEAEALLLEWRL